MQGKDYSKTTIINNRYRLISSIGRGSYGEVWLAEDLQLGINVAIKMYAALDDNGIIEFKNEFKSVYKLHHPNLLRPDYFDTDGGRPYLVMPFCPASASDQVGKMSEAEIWNFIRDVANGLAYLHANNVIHRDIKPANILCESGGAYVITDFGLSVKMQSSLRQASLRQSMGVGKTERKGTPLSEMSSGTIPYMAPELFSSKPLCVKATDIWALGVSIYELATGKLPFMGQGGGMQNAGAEIPDLDISKWSDNLNGLMHRCLSKATWDRPTAGQIVSIALQMREKKTDVMNSIMKKAKFIAILAPVTQFLCMLNGPLILFLKEIHAPCYMLYGFTSPWKDYHHNGGIEIFAVSLLVLIMIMGIRGAWSLSRKDIYKTNICFFIAICILMFWGSSLFFASLVIFLPSTLVYVLLMNVKVKGYKIWNLMKS